MFNVRVTLETLIGKCVLLCEAVHMRVCEMLLLMESVKYEHLSAHKVPSAVW